MQCPRTWSRIKQRIKGGGRGIHHFVDINAHPFQDHLVLVDQPILTARYVFSRSSRFGHFGGAHGDHLIHTSAYNATAYLQNLDQDLPPIEEWTEWCSTRVFSFGSKSQREIFAQRSTARRQQWKADFTSGPGRVVLSKTTRQPGKCTRQSSRTFAARTSDWAAGLHQLGSAHTPIRRMMPTRSHPRGLEPA